MNQHVVILGKLKAALKREGIRGIVSAFTKLPALFAPVVPGEVLLVSGGVGDSARYRCHHVAEELNRHGIRASVVVQDHVGLASYAAMFQVFVFHRVRNTRVLSQLVEQLEAHGKTMIFETDDFTYDPELFARTDGFQQMSSEERSIYQHGLGSSILANPRVVVATTTTSYLAAKLRERGKQVFVVPNKLSLDDVKRATDAWKNKVSDVSRITVGYFSGSASHNRDFATMADVLLTLLVAYPELRLLLAGPLTIDPRFTEFGDRVRQEAYIPREAYWETLSKVDINLAPLEIGDPFCEAKSELKFFEAGIVGVPTVAAATQTFREAIHEGEDGFVATTPDEWKQKLEILITDASRRQRMGACARATALARYTTDTSNDDYLQYLRTQISQK